MSVMWCFHLSLLDSMYLLNLKSFKPSFLVMHPRNQISFSHIMCPFCFYFLESVIITPMFSPCYSEHPFVMRLSSIHYRMGWPTGLKFAFVLLDFSTLQIIEHSLPYYLQIYKFDLPPEARKQHLPFCLSDIWRTMNSRLYKRHLWDIAFSTSRTFSTPITGKITMHTLIQKPVKSHADFFFFFLLSLIQSCCHFKEPSSKQIH